MGPTAFTHLRFYWLCNLWSVIILIGYNTQYAVTSFWEVAVARTRTKKTNKTYALVSHESAVEAIWALAARNWNHTLDDEDIWLVPAVDACVTTQGDLAQLKADVDLVKLGIRRDPIDLLVPNKSCYSRGKHATFHVWKDFFPPRSFARVHDRVLVSTPYFAALQLAMAHRSNRLSRKAAEASAAEDARLRAAMGIDGNASTPEELLRWGNIARLVRATQVLCDFMGTYRYVPTTDDDGSYRLDIKFKTKPIVNPNMFESYLGQMGTVRGIERAREVASLAFACAASPMETLLALMLSLPQSMGGFGLPRPKLNWQVPMDQTERERVSQDKIIADLCWPQQNVIVEYYGWDDHFGAGPHKVALDLARANSLSTLGWTVLHVTFEQINTAAGISLLARQLAAALGTSIATPSDLELVWRSRLLALLLPKTSRAL